MPKGLRQRRNIVEETLRKQCCPESSPFACTHNTYCGNIFCFSCLNFFRNICSYNKCSLRAQTGKHCCGCGKAIFLATCLATMTTEKHFKLQRGCHTFAIFFRNLQRPRWKLFQLFLRQLEISCEQKTGSDCLIFTKLPCRFRWTCHTQDISTFSCNSQRNILLPLQVSKLGCYT